MVTERIERTHLSEETRFGVYGVVLKKGRELTEGIRERLGFSADDTYLEIHVPERVDATDGKAILESFNEGFRNLAQYLEKHNVTPKALVGITHAGVAVWAGRYLNFSLTKGIPEEELDFETLRRVEEGFAKSKRGQSGNKERGPIFLCFQSFESFMEKFGRSSNLQEASS